MYKRLARWLALAGMAACGAAGASPVGYVVDTASDTLLSIDLGTGITTAVGASGSLGFGDVEGLSFQPGTGVLFGLDDSSDQLITIDLTTGVGTAIGSLGAGFSDAGLSFDAAGNLFASSDLGDDGVYSVDPLTGAATFLSASGPDPFALGFHNGRMFGVSDDCGGPDCLVSVDLISGVSTEIGDLGISADEGGLAFDAFGTLWFTDAGASTLYTINTATGAATAGATIDCHPDCRLEGLAIVAPFNTVPEPGPLGLLALGLLSVAWLRRRT